MAGLSWGLMQRMTWNENENDVADLCEVLSDLSAFDEYVITAGNTPLSMKEEMHLQEACSEFQADHLVGDQHAKACSPFQQAPHLSPWRGADRSAFPQHSQLEGSRKPHQLSELLSDFGCPSPEAPCVASKWGSPPPQMLATAAHEREDVIAFTSGIGTGSATKTGLVSHTGFRWNTSMSTSSSSASSHISLELPSRTSLQLPMHSIKREEPSRERLSSRSGCSSSLNSSFSFRSSAGASCSTRSSAGSPVASRHPYEKGRALPQGTPSATKGDPCRAQPPPSSGMIGGHKQDPSEEPAARAKPAISENAAHLKATVAPSSSGSFALDSIQRLQATLQSLQVNVYAGSHRSTQPLDPVDESRASTAKPVIADYTRPLKTPVDHGSAHYCAHGSAQQGGPVQESLASRAKPAMVENASSLKPAVPPYSTAEGDDQKSRGFTWGDIDPDPRPRRSSAPASSQSPRVSTSSRSSLPQASVSAEVPCSGYLLPHSSRPLSPHSSPQPMPQSSLRSRRASADAAGGNGLRVPAAAPASDRAAIAARQTIGKHQVSQPKAEKPSRSPRPPPPSPILSPRRTERQRCREEQSWVRRGLGRTSPVLSASMCSSKGESTPGHVKVLCRCRPSTPEDWAACSKGAAHIVHIRDSTCVDVLKLANSSLLRSFHVDAAFGGDSKTCQMFAELRPLVRATVNGAHASVLAYGPTGGGKTYTMYGNKDDPGLVLLAAIELLKQMGSGQLRMSMVELYNESLADLLVPRGQKVNTLKLRGGSSNAMPTIEGARTVCSSNPQAFAAAIQAGQSRRHVAPTMLNATSSRAHLVVTFSSPLGTLTMLDLCGTERLKRSCAEGNTLREAQSINRSLQGLSDVVDALRRGSSHVPFRASQLTRLVSSALSQGRTTAVIICMPPQTPCREEVLGALCFAERVRLIPELSST